MTAGSNPSPPVAERRQTRQTHHGFVLEDDYRWLKAENWQDVMRDPAKLPADIRAVLEAENIYTANALADTEALQATLFAEMKARIKEDDSTVPSPDGDWAYYTSYVTGGEYGRFCRKPRRNEAAPDSVLIDGDAMGKGLSYFSLGAAEHSPNHAFVAYATDNNGSEVYTIRIRDIATGHDLADEIGDTNGNLAWAADNRTILYTRLDDNHRPFAVYLHRLGTLAADDTLVYRETDPGYFVGIGKTLSGRFLVIDTHTHETSEAYLIEASTPEAVPRVVAVREPGHEYEIEHHGDGLVILTNRDGAEDFKIVTTPVDAPSPENWTEIEPHKPGRLILDQTAFKHHHRQARARGRAPARSSSAAGRTAPSTPSSSTRRPMRSASRTATSTTRRICASATRPSRPPPRSTTTTWRAASGACVSARKCRAGTIQSATSRGGSWHRRMTARPCQCRSFT